MLKFKNKWYTFSSGLAFYPEKVALELQEKARAGWRLKKINDLGFFIYEKSKPQEKQFTIDFYGGKKAEADDYLELYEGTGWENIYNYKKRYFFFKSDFGVMPIYSEAESYVGRMKKEWTWLFLSSLWFIPIGLVWFFLWNLVQPKSMGLDLVIHFIKVAGAVFCIAMPLGVLISILFNLYRYKDRPVSFKKQELMGKRQEKNFKKDLITLAIIGGIVGGFVGYFIH